MGSAAGFRQIGGDLRLRSAPAICAVRSRGRTAPAGAARAADPVDGVGGSGYHRTMRPVAVAVVSLSVLAMLAGLAGCNCGGPVLPPPPTQCSVVTGLGCLPDEQCTEGLCVPLERCEQDTDCPTVAFRCVFPAQFCELREGFGEECSEADGIPCGAGQFCALGRCRDSTGDDAARPCSTRLDCRPGQACDQIHLFCIEDVPCTLAEQGFPEAACNAALETCEPALGLCVTDCTGECESDDDCLAPTRCNGACRCVSCLTNTDCGPGLVCNVRNGVCQSENLCFDDSECDPPLVCDVRSALCQVAPPPCQDDFDCPIAEICNLENARCELPGGACIDDRFENADTPQSAEVTSIITGETPRLFDDLVLCPGDDDVYAVDLLAGDRLRVQVIERARQPELVGIARATVWLLDSDAETSVGFAETAPRGDGTINYTAQVDEVVYVRVNALLAETFYDLVLEKTRAGICEPDFFEGDTNNDEPATAAVIEPVFIERPDVPNRNGVDLEAEICPGDQDIYAVDLGADERLTATVSFDPSAADFDLAFVDVAGLVLDSSAGVDEPEVLSARVRDGGRVYVRVRPFGNARGTYTLHLRIDPAPVCADAFEGTEGGVDDDDDAPRLLVVPNVSADGQVAVTEQRALCGTGPQADADRWQIAVEDFERLVVRAVPADDDLRVVLSIENAAGDVLKRSAIGPGASTVGFDATTTGPLFVRAVGAFGQQGDYAITFAKENQTDCVPDDAEPNDVVADRATLVGDETTTTAGICESDEDYYAIEGSASKQITIDLTFSHGDADLDLQLLGLDGAQILATSDGQVDNERIVATLPLDGIYTIRVFSLTSGAKTQYSLTTKIASPE